MDSSGGRLNTTRSDAPDGPNEGHGSGTISRRSRFADLQFFSAWLKAPRHVGAVAASGPALARAIAAPLSPDKPGCVFELGPGTGPITHALVERGFSPDRLVLIEMNADFRAHLRKAFPGARIIDGDAFQIARIVNELSPGPLNAIVSGLPLLNWPHHQRLGLIQESLSILPKGQPFVQFSYGATAPVSVSGTGITVEKACRVWLNVPPAAVWIYRAA